jgi:phage portal protein BeeE
VAFWTRWVEERRTRNAPLDAAPQDTPERTGFEYGIPPMGLNEFNGGLSDGVNDDRQTMATQLYRAYTTCPWAWSCVSAVSRTITAGGLVTDWDTDTGEGDQPQPHKPAEVLALERLLAYCNPRDDIRQLLRCAIVDMLVFGDAFIEVVWLGDLPVALYNLDSASMYPIANEHGTITGYVQLTEFGQRAEFAPREIIHIPLDSPRNGVFGFSPTQAAMLPITAWLFGAANLKELYRKGAPPVIHVDMPAGMSVSDMNRWDANYARRNLGARNIGTPIVTRGGAHITELAAARIVDNLAFLDQKRDEILAVYGVPPAAGGTP